MTSAMGITFSTGKNDYKNYLQDDTAASSRGTRLGEIWMRHKISTDGVPSKKIVGYADMKGVADVKINWGDLKQTDLKVRVPLFERNVQMLSLSNSKREQSFVVPSRLNLGIEAGSQLKEAEIEFKLNNGKWEPKMKPKHADQHKPLNNKVLARNPVLRGSFMMHNLKLALTDPEITDCVPLCASLMDQNENSTSLSLQKIPATAEEMSQYQKEQMKGMEDNLEALAKLNAKQSAAINDAEKKINDFEVMMKGFEEEFSQTFKRGFNS
ncbi:MAG: hypothetical protein P8077_02735 [Gammaproteobacteria bacterium]